MTRNSLSVVRNFMIIAIAVSILVLPTLFGLDAECQNIRVSGVTPNKAFSPDSRSVGFELPVAYPLSEYESWSVVVADVNGDGKPDLIVASWSKDGGQGSEGSVDVLLGNGDGTLGPPVRYGTVGAQAFSLAVGDVNGDGKPDLVVANNCLSLTACNTGGGVTVLLGNGDGTFQPGTIFYSGGQSAESVAIADMNHDGHPDLIVINEAHLGGSGPGVVGILLGNGDGTFQPVVGYTVGNQLSQALAVGDLNADGNPDVVVVGDEDPGSVSVLLGNGDGTLQAQVFYPSGGQEPVTVAIGDVNGDGHPDLAVAQLCPDGTSCGAVSVLIGNGDGSFQSPVNYNSGGVNPTAAVIGDMNGDGIPDLIVADSASFGGPGELNVLLGNGNGTFQPPVSFPSAISPHGLAVADLNGDAKPDAVVVTEQPPSVTILLNNSGAAATSTALVAVPNPSTFGQSVTLTATVTSGSKTPTGPVIFYDGSTVVGTAMLAKKTAAISLSSPAVGSHTLLAVFQGSSKFAPSSSAPVSLPVAQATTITSITSSVNPVGIGQTVIYTATVAAQYSGAITGSMTFHDGGTTLATVALTGNQASWSTFYISQGTHSITAAYSGDANNAGSTSSVLTETAGNGAPISTKTSVVTSQSPVFVGQPVTFTATVTSTEGPIPDGETVTFYDGPAESLTKIGSATLSSGVAVLNTSLLVPGGHTITANYVGDATFRPSSGRVQEAVHQYTTSSAITSSLNPCHHGDHVILTVTVTSNGGPVPTGTVYMNGGIGNVTLSGGVAQVTMPFYHVDMHRINARYLGDVYNKASTAPTLIEVILRN
jgi:Bacterial Ig-like domain (group 3)/FG-GAP-like repeat